jgi:hypothetical protein
MISFKSTWLITDADECQLDSFVVDEAQQLLSFRSKAVSTHSLCQIYSAIDSDVEHASGRYHIICSCRRNMSLFINGSKIPDENITIVEVDAQQFFEIKGDFDVHPRPVTSIRFKFPSDQLIDQQKLIIKRFFVELKPSNRLSIKVICRYYSV